MICSIIYGVVDMLPEGVATTSYMELGIVAGIVTTMGVVITVCFSAMAVNKFVNMKSNKIHLY
jgi:cell division transport system permease protein